jgi:hypothetical protein
MNPETKTPDNDQPQAQVPNLTVVPGDAANSETCPLSPEMLAAAMPKKKKSKPKGKIAELPKEQRDLINSMLDDGATYKTIEEDMAKLGVSLNGENLSNWFNGPYQDYVRHCEWRAEMRLLRESASDVGVLSDGQQFQETLVQVSLTDIFRALRDPATKADPLNHIRLFNALARLNREALGLRKYNDFLAQQAAAQHQSNAEAPSAEKARDILFTAFERAMGVKAAPGPIGPDLNDFMARTQAAAATTGSAGIPAGEAAAEPATFNVQPATSPPPPVPPTGSPTHPLTTPPPPATRRKVAKSPAAPADRCHECRALLPPLLPSGERPSSYCKNCDTPLRPPGALIEYCPKCRRVMQELKADGTRPTNECLHCNKPLPPPPGFVPVANAVTEPPNIAA